MRRQCRARQGARLGSTWPRWRRQPFPTWCIPSQSLRSWRGKRPVPAGPRTAGVHVCTASRILPCAAATGPRPAPSLRASHCTPPWTREPPSHKHACPWLSMCVGTWLHTGLCFPLAHSRVQGVYRTALQPVHLRHRHGARVVVALAAPPPPVCCCCIHPCLCNAAVALSACSKRGTSWWRLTMGAVPW